MLQKVVSQASGVCMAKYKKMLAVDCAVEKQWSMHCIHDA